ncbi:hypothetical protein [Dactylosporangium sp. NPDC051541]|uniref:hypothetical protein n=1 Tax=Dactylosporangium sp. NPDC051541 TaxID=3363977 RepID=UPI0037897778
MGEDVTPPRRREEPKGQDPDSVPPAGRALGDTSLRFEPPPQEAVEDEAAKAPPRPRTPAPITPFAPAQPTVASTPFQKATPPPAQKATPPAQQTTPPALKATPPPARKAPPPPAQKAAPPPAQKAAPPAEKAMPAKKATPAQKAVPAQKAMPARKAMPAEEATLAQKAMSAQKATPAEEATPAKQSAPAKKTAAAKKTTPPPEPEPELPPPPAPPAAAKKAVAKKATPTKKATPAKKAPATKAPATKVPATKAAAKKTAPPEEPPAKKTAAKKAAVKKATPPAATTPEPEPIIEPPRPVISEEPKVEPTQPVSVDEQSDEPTDSSGLNPAYIPETLALAAVDRLAAGAKRRVGWYQLTYPGVDGEAISRAITREFVRRARRLGFAAGLVGPTGLVVEAAGVAWLQAKLVLHLAAAFGHDPQDRRRAAELLVLQRIHGTVETAEAAVRAAERADGRRANPRVAADRVGGPLARMVGGGLLRAAAARLARRVVPGAGLIVGSVTAARSTERLAARAVRYYRGFR